MATFYEMLEEPVLHHSLPCDDLLLLTPEPQSWNSSDSTLVSPVVSPKPCDLLLGINSSSVPAIPIKPVVPLENLLQDHSVKVQRLNRKAKLARENRKRKNSRLQELELECQNLREEVKRLRQRERDIALTTHQSEVRVKSENPSSIQAVLRQQLHDICVRITSASEDKTELYSAITGLKDFLIQKGHHALTQMRTVLDAEFQQPHKGPEQFLFWILSRDSESFFQDPHGMWKSLFSKHLDVDENKLKELQSLGPTAQEMRHNCQLIFEFFESMSKAYESVFSQGSSIISRSTAILSPEQISKFVKWVSDNQICVNELCLR